MKKIISCVLFFTMLFSLSTLFVNASDDNTGVDLSEHLDHVHGGRVSFSNVAYMEDNNENNIGFNAVAVYTPTETNEAKFVFTLLTANSIGGMVSQIFSETTIDDTNPLFIDEMTEIIDEEYYVYHPSTFYEEVSYTTSTIGYTSVHSVYPQTGSVRAEYSYILGIHRYDDNSMAYTIIEVIYNAQ